MSAAGQAPVVFINGLIGTLKCKFIEQALAGRPCAAPDLLGYGSLGNVAAGSVSIPAQIDHLEQCISKQFGKQKVHLVGHSVGGVVAYLFALQYPQRVLSVVSVEGNFSLKDAFWSSSIARLPAEEVAAMLATYREHPRTWLARSGLEGQPTLLNRAAIWLEHQSARTVQAMARSVVEITGSPDYGRQLRTLFERMPVRLLAGEKSLTGWDVPDWATEMAQGISVMTGCGHLMMLENPTGFGQQVAMILEQLDVKESLS